MSLFWCEGSTVDALPIDQYSLVTNPTLPTLPLFTLAGYFLAEGGASKRLIKVFSALVGSIKGGTVIMTFLVCAFFTTFTGASGVTILALGGLLLPVLLSAQYSEKKSLGIITSAGALGLLFPPSLPLILYAIIEGSYRASSCLLLWLHLEYSKVPKYNKITNHLISRKHFLLYGKQNGNCLFL